VKVFAIDQLFWAVTGSTPKSETAKAAIAADPEICTVTLPIWFAVCVPWTDGLKDDINALAYFRS
jgi:hypothetical protein